MCIRDRFRRRGIAGKLLAHALKEAAQHGIGDCTLEVRVSNTPAIHLYEEFGFRGEGIRPDFYEKPKEDALITVSYTHLDVYKRQVSRSRVSSPRN